MIKSFRHDGIKRFFLTGLKAGIQPKHANRLRLQLTQLSEAANAMDVNLPDWNLHPVTGPMAGVGRCR
jgi:proteic killer suppression protein